MLRENYISELKQKLKETKLFEKYQAFLKYLDKNYIDENGRFTNLINYNLDTFDFSTDNDLYIRSNNVIEGYHNRY